MILQHWEQVFRSQDVRKGQVQRLGRLGEGSIVGCKDGVKEIRVREESCMETTSLSHTCWSQITDDASGNSLLKIQAASELVQVCRRWADGLQCQVGS